MRDPDRRFERPDTPWVHTRAGEPAGDLLMDVGQPPLSLAGAAARMEQLRALAAAGHLFPEELQLLADFYLEEVGHVR